MDPATLMMIFQSIGALLGANAQSASANQANVAPTGLSTASSFQGPVPTTSEKVIRPQPAKSLPSGLGQSPASIGARPEALVIPEKQVPATDAAKETAKAAAAKKSQEGFDFKGKTKEFLKEALLNLVTQQPQFVPVSPGNTQSTFQGGVVDPFTLLANRRRRLGR